MVTNPFSIESSTSTVTTLSLESQLSNFEKDSYALWIECNGHDYTGQSGEQFMPVGKMMQNFWSFHKTKSIYPTLVEIAKKVIL